jgi:hypothetical protein
MLYHAPYGEWALTGPGSPNGQAACTPSVTCVSGYPLQDTHADEPLVYSLGIYPSYAFGDHGQYGHIVTILGATNGFNNDGFGNTAASGSTLTSVGPIWLAGLGYGVSREWGRASVILYRPLTDGSSPVDYWFGLQVTVGVNLEALHRKDMPNDPAPWED